MKHRVFALWKQFESQVIHPAAPDEQRREMRRAFYAGVEGCLNRLASEISPGDSLDDPNDECMMDEVNQELQQFAEDVKKGQA